MAHRLLIYSVVLGLAIILPGGCSTTSTSTSAGSSARTITFSGYRWTVKTSSTAVGPGPNRFFDSTGNVWVDGSGDIHLKITKIGNSWHCAEIISEQAMGYGDYTYYVSSRVDQLDKNVVFGLFTWDDNTFQTDANSEIDIEFARWGVGNDTNTLQYTVQPDNQGEYLERSHRPTSPLSLTGNDSTHTFHWAGNSVQFSSYQGSGKSLAKQIDTWEITNGTTARRKTDQEQISNAVAIPHPGTTTKARMNLWLFDGDHNGLGDDPSDGKEVEVVVHKFEYTPL